MNIQEAKILEGDARQAYERIVRRFGPYSAQSEAAHDLLAEREHQTDQAYADQGLCPDCQNGWHGPHCNCD